MKRLVVLAVAAIGFAAASPAGATEYPPGEDQITVGDATPCPGQAFTVTASTFVPGTTVTVTLLPDAVLGTPVADENGVVTLDVTLSATQALGEATIEAEGAGTAGEGDALILTSTVDVVSCDEVPPTTAPPATAPGGGGGGNLPNTGSDSTMTLLKVGGGLAAIGGVLVALAASRRRRGVPAV